MSCEYCDRENIIKSYCYYSHRPEAFLIMAEKQFTLENFVNFALEMQLRCRLVVTCRFLRRAEIKTYWSTIEPMMKEILQRPKSLEDRK
jgi:hypothetical protein